MLDLLETAIDRLKVMYEQYFLGIAKVAPSHLHTDAERKMREIAQVQIRNTALRWRFATLQQKFGSYNTYWRRTLRQIENGTYVRSLSKVKRKYENSGGDIPDEILAAMPKRMREQVARDRVAATAAAGRRGQLDDADLPGGADFRLPDLYLPPEDLADDVAEITSPVPREDLEEDMTSRVITAEMDRGDIQQMLADLAAPDVRRPAAPAAPAVKPPQPPPPRPPTAALPRVPDVPRERPSRPSVQAATLPSLGPLPRPPVVRFDPPPAGRPEPPAIPPPPQRQPTAAIPRP